MIGRRVSFASIFAALAISVAALPAIGSAAQPRPSVSVGSASVKLSDLFSGLEPGQDCDIGPAPAPGKRITIEQPQLAAIAEQFGVEWQPGVIATRVVLERKARSVGREELLPLLRSALVAAGAPEDSDVSLVSFAPLLVPAEDTALPSVDSLDFSHASGRFVADLLFDNPGNDPTRLRVSGIAQEMIAVPILARAMNAGSVIAPDDIEIRRLGRSLVGERVLLTPQELVGLALRHRMTAGSPVSADQVGRPLLVTRGMPVLLRLENTGLTLTAKGQALEGGAQDERIHVLNPDSRAVLVARVTGPGQVQVDPASTPVLLSSQQSGLPPAYSLNAMTQSSNDQGPVR